jgi:hypothetical protein
MLEIKSHLTDIAISYLTALTIDVDFDLCLNIYDFQIHIGIDSSSVVYFRL